MSCDGAIYLAFLNVDHARVTKSKLSAIKSRVSVGTQTRLSNVLSLVSLVSVDWLYLTSPDVVDNLSKWQVLLKDQ